MDRLNPDHTKRYSRPPSRWRPTPGGDGHQPVDPAGIHPVPQPPWASGGPHHQQQQGCTGSQVRHAIGRRSVTIDGVHALSRLTPERCRSSGNGGGHGGDPGRRDHGRCSMSRGRGCGTCCRHVRRHRRHDCSPLRAVASHRGGDDVHAAQTSDESTHQGAAGKDHPGPSLPIDAPHAAHRNRGGVSPPARWVGVAKPDEDHRSPTTTPMPSRSPIRATLTSAQSDPIRARRRCHLPHKRGVTQSISRVRVISPASPSPS